jgi:uncharacterized protein
VPLLILWFAYGDREATGTSLLAIVFIATLAGFAQGLYGNVNLAQAALVGVPAIGGVLAGTALQQRVLPERAVSLIFAVALVVVAVELIIP